MTAARSPIFVNALKALASNQLEAALALPPNALIGLDIGPKLGVYAADRSVQAERGKLKLALQAGLGLRVDLLNSASDQKEDATGVFGKASADKDYGIAASPRLHANPNKGWLKYAFSGSLRAETSQDLGLASFSLEASREIEYAAYRPHPFGERIASAILSDLGSMPSALDVDDVSALAPGEAVSVRVPGRVNFSLDLDESVFASTSLRPLASVFGLAGPVALAFSRSVKFSLDLSFEDDTRLVFLGMDDGWVHTSLRKARGSTLGISAGMGFNISLPQESQKMLVGGLSQALFGATEAALDELTQLASFGQLNDVQQQLLKALGIQFGERGIGDALLAPVRQKLADRKAKLITAVEEILKTRLEIGFKFEYSRVSTDGSLFEAELSPAAVRELHPKLLRFDLRDAVDLARKQDATRLRNFFLLHERNVERTATLGFTLGFGKWLRMSASTTGKRRLVEQINHLEEKRLAWISSRAVAGAFNDGETITEMTFRADTEEFRKDPKMADLKLAISMDSQQSGMKPKHLLQLLDLAALWRAYPPASLSAQVSRAQAFLGEQDRFDASIALRVSDRLVRAMAQWITSHDNQACAPLLARSLPYWKGYEAREVEALRESVYTPAFHAYLAAEDWPRQKQRIRNLLVATQPNLASAERENRTETVSFVGYATKHDAIGNRPIGMRIDALRLACKQIVNQPGGSANEMSQILDDFYNQKKVFADRSFTVRFFGALLSQIAIDSGYDAGWNASLTLSYKGGDGKPKVLIIGKAQA